ncbi:hypothetical protein TNCV_3831051 [Trichonephila clavipes]|nr:hypothetical protein TNCV_3831051 [Trichonephila clavipes]
MRKGETTSQTPYKRKVMQWVSLTKIAFECWSVVRSCSASSKNEKRLPVLVGIHSCIETRGDNGAFNDKTGCKSSATSSLQMSPGSASSIIMDFSVSRGTEKKSGAFDIIIRALHHVYWYGPPLGVRHQHLLFASLMI